ncbi:hypothetical protein WICPIJ_008147 [Wickerhamomyces pijperi]|uniref:Uncharacterized protein n=1 Tax=Wickerhamomyces pijperi TaxID=599730 RepID=A0A9P8PYK9_WICPI|nr:hypothetical protein WICPIJ_008147 [Wickerhamomyces pijperi]
MLERYLSNVAVPMVEVLERTLVLDSVLANATGIKAGEFKGDVASSKVGNWFGSEDGKLISKSSSKLFKAVLLV